MSEDEPFRPRDARLLARLRPVRDAAILTAVAALSAAGLLVGGLDGPAAPVLAAAPMLAGLATLWAGLTASAGERDRITGLRGRGGVVGALDRALACKGSGAAMVIEIDRFRVLEESHDTAVVEHVLGVAAGRLAATLHDSDLAGRLDGPTFAVALSGRRLDLDEAVQLAGRIQRALADPVAVQGLSIGLTASIGFALPGRLPEASGEGLLQAATLALIEAQRSGPGSVRSYSAAMRSRVATRNDLAEEAAAALKRGEVEAFFQPQVSARTGAVTGFEALARWRHPTRGLVPPAEFLPALEEAGLMARLGERMIHDALSALRFWDRQGMAVPRVGVNFSSAELCDPCLVDRIGWELDRFEIAPERLVVEVLETVVAGKSDDVVVRNLAGLSRLGCRLDLDDFGTGHASITSIRRFCVERIKIDRSFVTGIDKDAEQGRMVAAILTMAERLGLDTLAEGVESEAERASLQQLGCGHVQGFGVARPMPLGETVPWMRGWALREGGMGPRQFKAV